MFEFTENPVTKSPETNFSGKLLDISDVIQKNVNGKNYKLATIQFENAKEIVQKATALVYEGNYKYGVTVGQNYLCTARITEQGVLIQMSHLQQIQRASADDFGFEGVLETVEDEVNAFAE